MKHNQKGFSVVEVLIIVIVLGAVGFIGWKMIGDKTSKTTTNNAQKTAETAEDNNQPTQNSDLIWQQSDSGWRSSAAPPDCKQPFVKMPADISKITSVLYPGQTRGGNYKTHGGFRFDNTKDNKITVTAPFDAYLVRGGSYLAENEIQYTFDAINNCGVMYRVGHVRELPDRLIKIADTWPAASNNSATQSIDPPMFIKQGEILGTKVGIISEGNTFFDFGLYDYRQENEASKNSAYQSAHTQDKELSWHAVCWLKGWLPAADQSKLLALPAGDPNSEKNSDYCK